MDKSQFWQNFDLGTELHISGGFIYNGLKCLHDMQTLHFEEEIFEVFYNLSVGIERMLKVAIVLLEHDTSVNQEEFEKSLITHNHLTLLARITPKYCLNLSTPHNEFLQLLSTFYKTYRYDRYSLHTVDSRSKDKSALLSFLTKHLSMDLNEDGIKIARNEVRIRRFIGKLVGKISGQLYDAIHNAASSKNIYTYEIRHESKASKIFIGKEYTFENENILWKEIIVYLMNNNDHTRLLDLIREIVPLELDPGLLPDYLECLGSDTKKISNMDEVVELYSNLTDKKKRLETLEYLLGETSAYVDTDWDEEVSSEENDPSDGASSR